MFADFAEINQFLKLTYLFIFFRTCRRWNHIQKCEEEKSDTKTSESAGTIDGQGEELAPLKYHSKT